MKYLHAMIRVHDLDATSHFLTAGLGLVQTRRMDSEAGKFTLVYFAAPANPEAEVELTHNWGSDEDYGSARNFGHLAFEVDDIYALCAHLQGMGSPSTARRAMAGWRLCARRIGFPSNCCKKALPCLRRNRGHRWPTAASGEARRCPPAAECRTDSGLASARR